MMFYLRSALLAPVLFAQGKHARRTVPVLPEPAGEREGRAGSGQPVSVLIAGDSGAAGVGAETQDEALLGQLVTDLAADFSVTWNLQATSGHTTARTLDRLERLPQQHFDVAVTSLGVNDAISMVSLGNWRRRQARLRELLRQKFGVETLIVSGLPPMHGFPALPQPLRWHIGARATQFDRALARDVHAEEDAQFIDLRFTEDMDLMASDGFHPGPGIYAAWARLVAAAIRAR